MWTRCARRSTPTAAARGGCSAAFRCRIVHMPDQTGNSAESRALDLRLWVPAEGDLRGIAGELAAKIAEQLGAGSPDAQQLGERVSVLASKLANGGGLSGQITFEFRQVKGELVVQARCNGEASEVRQPLPV